MVTISKIAKLANVSRGTVDRVIHGRGRVSRETELKVKRILKDINYQPNVFARGLSLSKTYNFAVLLPDTSNNVKYWDLPLIGIEKAKQELDSFRVNIEYFLYNNFIESSFRSACNKVISQCDNLDGLLIAPALSKSAEHFIKEIPSAIPYVFFDTYLPNTNNLSYIGPDSYQSGLIAARLLLMIMKSVQTIAVIRECPENYHIDTRIKGFTRYCAKNSDCCVKVYEIDRRSNTVNFPVLTDIILTENQNLNGIFVPSCSVNEVAEYIEKLNLEKKIYITGYDLTVENLACLNSGSIDFLINQRPEVQGYQGIYTLYNHVVLQKDVDHKIYVPLDITIKENADYYYNFFN